MNCAIHGFIFDDIYPTRTSCTSTMMAIFKNISYFIILSYVLTHLILIYQLFDKISYLVEAKNNGIEQIKNSSEMFKKRFS